MALSTPSELAGFLDEHPEWTDTAESLGRTFEFNDFVAAMGFVTSVAILAEKAFHHPDIDSRWNKVTITLTTHDEGGLTKKDTTLAAAIENLI